jgi:hypothetical protein
MTANQKTAEGREILKRKKLIVKSYSHVLKNIGIRKNQKTAPKSGIFYLSKKYRPYSLSNGNGI